MTENSHDGRRENELIMDRPILIDIYKGEYEVRGKIYRSPSSRDSKNRARGSVIEL